MASRDSMSRDLWIGRYHVERLVGADKGYVTYHGRDSVLDRPVVLLTATTAPDDPESAGRLASLAREAQAVGRVSHPNVWQVLDYCVEGDVTVLVREFFEGETLRERLDAGARYSPDEALGIACDILAGLEAVHAAGVWHRNLRATDVVIAADGRVKLTNFGLASAPDLDLSAIPDFDPEAMSPEVSDPVPEQILGIGMDHRADIYSTAVILYWMLAGERPFSGGGVWVRAKNILQKELPPIAGLAPSLAQALNPVLARALAKDPAGRFASAADFADALRACLRQSKAGGNDCYIVFGELGPGAAGRSDDSLTDAEIDENWRHVRAVLEVLGRNGVSMQQCIGSQFMGCFRAPEDAIAALLESRAYLESLPEPARSGLPARIAVNFGPVTSAESDGKAYGDAVGASSAFHARCRRPGLFFTHRAYAELPGSLKLALRRSDVKFDPPLKAGGVFAKLIGSDAIYEL